MLKKILILLLLIVLTAEAADKTITIDSKYITFFNNYCIDCHNEKKTKGKVRLDKAFSFDIKTVRDADQWQKILEAINSEEMPPEDDPQPLKKDKLEFLDMLSLKLVEARKALSDSGGVSVIRRLNQREYKNTIMSLLGVEVDVDTLPADDSGSHFDTDGSSLFMSPDQIEQYLEIARQSIKKAMEPQSNAKAVKRRIQPEKSLSPFVKKQLDKFTTRNKNAQAYFKSKKPNRKPKDFGIVDEGEAKVDLNMYKRFSESYKYYVKDPLNNTGSTLNLHHPASKFRVTLSKSKKAGKKNNTNNKGLYKVRVRAGLTDTVDPERAFISFGYLMEDGSFKRLNNFHITENHRKGQIIETEYLFDEHPHLIFREKQDEESAIAYYAAVYRERGRGPDPTVWIDWVEVEGPFKVNTAKLITELRKALPKFNQDAYLKAFLKKVAVLAFRNKPVEEDFINKLVAIYKEQLKLLKSPSKAIVEPLAIILSTPSFLYLNEPLKDKKVKQLNDLELANRLSYFLWSSPPDYRLMKLAKENQLHKPENLRLQVERLLADPKAMNFYRSFSHQWLHLQRLDFFQFNRKSFPRFDQVMKDTAKEEVFQTMKFIVDNNLSTKNFLKSNFVVVNGLMANHYGMKGIKGENFRMVKLPKNSIRGGLTGMAAILAMGSDGEHTSPVERGAWVLRKILNEPPPPAPANVPQLSRLEKKKLTVKQMVKIHQEEPQCAHCHKKIDPIGFGMENFDPIGKWRTHDVRNKNFKYKIDPSAALYRGPSFRNYLELREIFVSRHKQFNNGLIKQLLAYALGREIGFTDDKLIESIEQQLTKKKSSMRELIHAVVQSASFRQKK